jgi:hypothetical protein
MSTNKARVEGSSAHAADNYRLTVCGITIAPGVAIVPMEKQVTCGGCRMVLGWRADKRTLPRGRVTG